MFACVSLCVCVGGHKTRLPATLSNFCAHDLAATLPVGAATAAAATPPPLVVAAAAPPSPLVAVIAARKPCGCVGNSDVDNCERLLTLALLFFELYAVVASHTSHSYSRPLHVWVFACASV